MRGRRVISLLLSLVMALSLCSGVWADNEVTASDEGVTTSYGGRTVRFYTGMGGGYLKYDPNDPRELKVDGGNIDYAVGADTTKIPAFFIRNTGDFSSAHLFLAIDKNDGEETAPTLLSSDGWLTLRNENSNDGGKFVYALSVTGDRNNGDTAFITLDGQTMPFAIVFEKNNGSEGGSQFAGVSEALKNAPDDAKAYGTKYLNNDTGRLNCQNSDDGGILVKNNYTDAEKEAIKSAVRAFRAFRDGQHDNTLNTLSEMGDIDFDGKGWGDCFGRYLAELASRVGISLWSDDVQDGVEAAVGNYTVKLYTNGDYGVFSLDTAAKVSVDNGKYTMSWDYEQLFFKVTCSTDNESRPALSYNNNDTVQSIHNEGDRMEDGKKVYIYRVQLKRPNQEHEVEFTIGNGESAPKFTVKFVDPNPWNPDDIVNANNATGALGGLYKNGFKAPAYGTNFHLRFPDQLHGYDAAKAADYAAGTDHWDYKWSYDTNTGIVTVEVNADHEECWKNCIGRDDVITDGVYFDYWIGGSGESKPAAYGTHLNFDPEGETPDYRYDILTGDYEHSNGWKMAVANQRSTTSTVLTFKEGTVSYGEVVAMSNDEANNEQPVSNAEYKYALQFNVVTNATKAIKLDTDETQNVPRDRVTSFTTVSGVDSTKWKCEVPEDGTAFVLYNGDDYTTASAVTQAYGNLVLTNLVGTLGFKVPDGYTTLNYVIDDHSSNYINSGNNGVNPLSVTAGNEVRFPVFKARYNSIKLVWSDSTGKTLTESLLVELGNATPWMDLLGSGSTSAKPANTIMNGQTEDFLQENGITVTYNEELGYFSTRVDASKLNDLSALNYAAALTPVQGAAYFKVFGFGGSEAPFAHGEERKTQVAAWLAGENPIPLAELDVNDIAALSLIQIDTLTANGLTVYFSETQLFSGVVIQWLDADQQVLGYTYVYGRNGDFVTSVPTETKPEVNEAVDAPTLEWNGDTDPGFTCDRNPQTGGNGSKVFFQFSVKYQGGMPEGGWTIYLPYEYFGDLTWEKARTQTTKPMIYHYFDESCSESNREVLYGEYTPYGVMFKTRSFSPFVVDCSAAVDATSGTHRHHSTAAAKADSPETFDGGIALYGALAVSSLTGMAYVTKKRED